MGQKIHPIGLRIGSLKPYQSTWFKNPNSYSQSLLEDYKIRQFFQKRWSKFYSQAGIIKLEIKKNEHQIELLIHSTNTTLIRERYNFEVGIPNIFLELKQELGEIRPIRLILIENVKYYNESLPIANFLARTLEKRIPFRRTMRDLAKKLHARIDNGIIGGFKIQVSGRLNGAEIARTEWIRGGRVPLQTIQSDINYSNSRAFTKQGVLGVKVWIFNTI